MSDFKMSTLARSILAGGVSGPAGPSLPQSANIVFDLDPESLALADGATASSWTDSSVNALTFTGTGTYRTNQLGGKPCVSFSGAAGQYMSAARAGTALDAALTSQVCTTIIVAKSRGTNSLGCMFGSNAGGNSNFMVIDGAQGSSAIGRYANNVTSRVAPAVNAANMFVMVHTSTKPYAMGTGTGIEHVYLNGTCVTSDNNPAPVPNQTNFGLAAQGAGGQRALLDVFRVIVYNARLTPAEAFEATDYLFDHFGQVKPWAAVSDIVVYDGNSLVLGVGSGGVAGSYPYKSAQAMGLAYGQWTNVAVGGITATNMQTKLPEWSGIGAATGKGMKVAAFEYYNQKGSGAAATIAASNAYIAAVKAVPNTKLCWGTSLSHAGDPDTTRNAFNAAFDADHSNVDSYVPLHLDASIGAEGADSVGGNAYFNNSSTKWSDIVHLNGAGYTDLHNLMTPGIQAL